MASGGITTGKRSPLLDEQPGYLQES